MDRKDNFDRRARRGLGPMEPAEGVRGKFTSADEAVFERTAPPVSKTLPRQIEFRRKNKSWFSFPYHCLMSIEYVPHCTIIMTFSTHAVAVSGRDLNRLYQDIRTQRCESVEQADRATALASESDGVVDEISICEVARSGGTVRKLKPGIE